MNRAKIILWVVVIAVVAGGGALLWPRVTAKDKNFSVVYLQSNEIYVGRLSHFPRLVLHDAHLVQTIRDPKDETKSNFQLIPLNETVWAPKELYIDLSHVLFYGPLDENSKAAKALKDAGR